MNIRRFGISVLVLAGTLLVGSDTGWAVGFELGESKEQLGLDYAVVVTDHGTGRVTIKLTIVDEGRLQPLTAVKLMLAPKDGTRHVDLSLSLARDEEEGNQVYRVHILKELVERAEIHLVTSHLDGRQQLLTWYYHSIRLSEYLDSPPAEATD